MLIKCPECGRDISDQAKNCPHCGYPIEKKIYCPECGAEVAETDETCAKCGYPLKWQTGEPEYPELVNNAPENVEPDPETAVGESSLSISCLVCYVVCVIMFLIGAYALGAIMAGATIILLILSYTIRSGKKCTCANIVFWINTIAFVLFLVSYILIVASEHL